MNVFLCKLIVIDLMGKTYRREVTLKTVKGVPYNGMQRCARRSNTDKPVSCRMSAFGARLRHMHDQDTFDRNHKDPYTSYQESGSQPPAALVNAKREARKLLLRRKVHM